MNSVVARSPNLATPVRRGRGLETRAQREFTGREGAAEGGTTGFAGASGL